VVEARRRLPALLRVAIGTAGSQLAGVTVFMARDAVPAKPKETLRGIAELDLDASGSGDLRGCVATLALLFPVLAFQREASLAAVVEGLLVKPGEGEVLAVMFHMASGTVALLSGVESGPRLDAALNLRVAFEALETPGASPEIVAGRTAGDSFELLMDTGKRTGRNLRGGEKTKPEDTYPCL